MIVKRTLRGDIPTPPSLPPLGPGYVLSTIGKEGWEALSKITLLNSGALTPPPAEGIGGWLIKYQTYVYIGAGTLLLLALMRRK